MKMVVMQFVTLDGVSQVPGSVDEDRTDGFTRGCPRNQTAVTEV